MLVLSLAVVQAPRSFAQTQARPDTQTKVAALHEPSMDGTVRDGGGASDSAPAGPAAAPDPEISPAVAKQFAAMQAEIEQLRAELRGRSATEPASPSPGGSTTSAAATVPVKVASAPATTSAGPAVSAAQSPSDAPAAKPAKQPPSEPFAFADWSWMNGSPHNKEPVWDSKFFTPEIRLDTDYVSSFNHPKDDTLGGSTEIFRSNEVQVEQISFGGDFHWQNVRGRILTLRRDVFSNDAKE
jgi:hypothetical protein